MWDDAKEKQLLLSIIHFLQPSAASIPWAEVAKAVDADASEKACSEKLKKLRYAAKAAFGDRTAALGEAPKTPAKRGGKKANGETPAKSTGKRKSKKLSSEDAAIAEEDAGEESPAKKMKAEADDAVEDEI